MCSFEWKTLCDWWTGLSSVEVYDPSTESWSAGVALPSEVKSWNCNYCYDKIYLIGGKIHLIKI